MGRAVAPRVGPRLEGRSEVETKAPHVIVGAFVVLFAAGIVAFLVWAAKLQLSETRDVYRIYLTGSVTGLQEGSAVRYRGIPVGSVSDVRLDPVDVSRVLAVIKVKPGTPVKSDSVATLETQGLTGGSYIQISGGTEAAQPIEGADDGPPIIPSRRSTLATVVDRTPELLNQSVELIERVSSLVSDENREAISATLQNVKRASGEIANVSAGLAHAVGAIDGMTTALEAKTLPAADKTLTEARATMASIREDLKTLTDSTVEAEKAVKTAATRFGDLAGDNRQAVRDFASSGLYDATRLINELRGATDRLSRYISRLDADTPNTLFGGTRQGLEVRGK